MKPFASFFQLLLWVGLLLVGCVAPQSETLRIESVKGYTLSGEDWISFESMVMQDGMVVGTGTTDEMRELAPEATVVDGQGRVMLPGLIDAHAHVVGLGQLLTQVDLTGATSLDETLQRVEQYAIENPESPWIVGRGWNQELWEDTSFPTAQDLDQVVNDRPVFLSRIDGHAAWVNSVALQQGDVTRETQDPVGGRVIRDDQGDPTGILVDAAETYVARFIPQESPEQIEEAVSLAIQEMLSLGITGVHDAGVSQRVWQIFQDLDAKGELAVHINAMVGGVTDQTRPWIEKGPVEPSASSRLSLTGVKIYSDGALGSRGAAMLEPYDDEPGNQGLLFYDQSEMNEQVLTAVSNGFQANVHAIGDAANRQVLDALEEAINAYPESSRHRVEHAQVVAVEDIPRFAELELIASMQPTHATSDKNMAQDRIGVERLEGAYAWRTFLDQGTIIAAGSDFPVEPVNPFYGIHASVTRQDRNDQPPGGWLSDEAMTLREALRAFTLDAAYAAKSETLYGSLEPGKMADFILIDRDPFQIPPSELDNIEVLETWVEGKKVFSQESTRP